MKKSVLVFLGLLGLFSIIKAQLYTQEKLYNLNTGLQSRSISFENPTGEKGQGGKTSNHLGIGRKGFPAKQIAPNEEVILCDIEGPGTIRHIWMTGDWKDNNQLLRTTIIRAYWDGQKHPSIECPLGDFMGLAHGKVTSYQSSVHSVGENAALNIWLPMPFTRHARITLKNESDISFTLFYQIDYTINDEHDEDIGRLHVCFRRENPTIQKNDFEILPARIGKGRFIGAVIGIRTLYTGWWGEGEIKFYMDGDHDFPTICGTGSEDYVGLSYGIQQATFLNHGCNLIYNSDSVFQVKDYFTNERKDISSQYISMYRWHLPDPIYWEKECRVTIQQIGWSPNVKNQLFERQDDWSSATFWYEPVPSDILPELPSAEKRIMDLKELFHVKE
jgi:hypothetical protein